MTSQQRTKPCFQCREPVHEKYRDTNKEWAARKYCSKPCQCKGSAIVRTGKILKPVKGRLEKYSLLDPNTGCWVWTASRFSGGYGCLRHKGKNCQAHRLSYEIFVGPIPDGLVIDHLCRNPSCINPDHLEPVTMRENVHRGIGPCAKHAVKTHCLRGHPFAGDNLRVRTDGYRACRECERIRARQSALSASQETSDG